MTHDQSGAPGSQAWLPGDLPAPLAAPAPEPQPAYQPQPAFQPQPTFQSQPPFQPQPAFQPPAAFGGPTPYPGQAPYGQPGYYGPPATPKPTPVLAILSLVFAFLAPIVGLVLAIVALLRGKVDGNGRGLAIAGLVTSLVMTPLYAAVALPVYLNQRRLAEEAEVQDAFDRITTAMAYGDCDGYLTGSTFAFQQQTHATTCEQFDVLFTYAGDLGDWLETMQVTDVRVESDDAWVTTTEWVVWDEFPTAETFAYWMVREDGDWLLNSASMLD